MLKKEGRPDIRLAMLNQSDPGGELVDTLAEVCKGEAEPSLVALSAARVAERAPAQLSRAMGIVAGQKRAARQMFHSEVHRVAPDWAAQHVDELKSLVSEP